MKKMIIAAAALILVLGAAGFYIFKKNTDGAKFRTEKAARGNISASVTATGTVAAEATVLVGTQVSGTIRQLNVDYNSIVKKGMLLAQIDPAIFQAQVEQARANLKSAAANVEKSEAALLEAKRTLERNKTLFARNFIARSDMDASETNYLSAQAQLNVTKAQVEQAKAALLLAETNLQYTRILSPVDGIVISRNVDIGQTVAASFQTPTLFNIARDLTRMQIETSIDEADIGKIKAGLPVQFTVDAHPDILFVGRIAEIRNAPTTISNVVTYTVIIKVDNPELRLKPGMTANVTVVTDNRENVLKVPNAALRFKMAAERATDKGKSGSPAKRPEPTKGQTAQKTQALWLLENDKPRRVVVSVGISDGSHTEITSGELKEGDAVIIEASVAAKKTGSTSPIGGPGFIR